MSSIINTMESVTEESKMDNSLQGIRSVIPPKYLKSHFGYASLYLITGFIFYLLSNTINFYVLQQSYYWLYPITWFIAGTAVTSLFVIGHDCAHESFLSSKKANSFWGHITFAFSFYPYHAWKYSHAAHHKYTNLLKVTSKHIYFDNAWLPQTVSLYKRLKRNSPFFAWLLRASRTFLPLGSTIHNITTHFYPSKFKAEHRGKVYFSYLILAIYVSALSAGAYFLTGSIYGIIHLVLLPGLFFQFWMSAYTYLHHNGKGATVYKEGEWNQFKGQVLSTINCYTPKFISFLHFHIDYHLPHHVTIRVPSYYLPEVQTIFKESEYSKYIIEEKFTLPYVIQQIKTYQLWDEEQRTFVRFSSVK